jgi:hypothetical protein
VQRDGLDSMGSLLEQAGDVSSGRLSSQKPCAERRRRRLGHYA